MRPSTTALLLASLAATAASASADELPAHHLLVASQGNDRVLAFHPGGDAVASLGADSGLSAPSGFAVGPDGLLYVASWGTHRVLVLDGAGEFVATLGEGSGLSMPRGVAFGPDGNLYVGDGGAGLVRVLSADDGSSLGTVGSDLVNPLDLAFGRDGHLFVACGVGDVVSEFDASGVLVREIGADSELSGAGGLAVGSDGRLYVASTSTNSVLVFDADGDVVDELGLGVLDMPTGLAFDPEGRLAVVSQGTSEVVLLTLDDEVADTFGGSLDMAFGAAYVPVRFPCTLKGALVTEGDALGKTKATVVLSVAPGGSLMLALDDGLAATLGQSWFVLPAQQTLGPAGEKQRAYLGSWASEDAATPGLLSLSVGLLGKVDKKTGRHVPKRVRGTLLFGDPDNVLLANATSGKPLN